MGDFQLTFARSARKELERLPAPIADRILERIEQLMGNPRPAGVVKLHGHANLRRLRVGDYRVIFSIHDAQRIVDISAVRHRRDVYRDL
jgi:mRNA interferase RelE/StbE